MGEVSQDLNHCPFCNAQFPKGPAYYCPKCGKKLDEAFSKRNFFDEASDSLYYSEKAYIDDNNLENSFDDVENGFDLSNELKNDVNDFESSDIGDNGSISDNNVSTDDLTNTISELNKNLKLKLSSMNDNKESTEILKDNFSFTKGL